jgi:phytoene desaturase
MNSKKIIVVGSGFGGLAVGLRLLAAGHKVTILEKREKIGGRAYQIIDKGYTFDMGPSLITAPILFDELFELFGKERKDFLDFVLLDPFYRVYFEEAKSKFVEVDYNGDPSHMKSELEKLEKGAGEKYELYYKKVKPIYDTAYVKLGAKPFGKLVDLIKVIPEMLRLDAIRSVSSIVSDFFKSEFAHRLYSFHPLYLGANPKRAPGALSFIPYLERDQGVWFAEGGMYSVITALSKLFTDNGGEIITNSEVVAIETVEKKVKSVRTKDSSYDCDILVSNADALKTFEMTSSSKSNAAIRRLKNAEYSMSLFMLYIGTKKQYREKLRHHTLILGKDYNKLLDEIFDKKIMPTSLSMYLHIPSVSDKNMAPENCESMYVLLPMPNLAGSIKWNQETSDKVRNWVVEYLEKDFGLEKFSEMIEVEHRFIPTDFESQLNSHLGSAFATELRLMQSVYFRQHNKSDEFENLYFVGASTHPGPGVPGVLLSAKCTADLIY